MTMTCRVIGMDVTSAVRQAAGIGRYTRQLLTSLSSRQGAYNYRLFYCAAGELSGSLPPLSGRFRVRRVPVSDRVLNAAWHRARLPLPVQLVTGHLDLFHSPDFTLPPVLGKPTVLTVHDLAFLRVPQCAYPTLRQYLMSVVPRSAHAANRIIAVSENTRQDVIELLRVPPERVTTVLEGVGAQFFPLEPDQTQPVLDRLGIQRPYILAVGTLEPRKNYVRLLEAYARLRERGVEHGLVIAGARGWMYEPIFRRVAELQLSSHLSFVSPADADLPSLYSAADAFVYPSLYEGFGIPPLEALACGVPVVASNVASLPEVVGDAGLLVDPEQVEAIAAGVERILSDRNLASALRLRAPERAALFSWDRAAEQTCAIYEELLADG